MKAVGPRVLGRGARGRAGLRSSGAAGRGAARPAWLRRWQGFRQAQHAAHNAVHCLQCHGTLSGRELKITGAWRADALPAFLHGLSRQHGQTFEGLTLYANQNLQ